LGLTELILLAVVAAGAGVVGSMLGLGGGIFIVPLFTIFFGIDQKAAIGASAVAVVANSVVGSTVHLRSRFTNLRLAMLLQVTTALGATLGAVVGVALDQRVLSGVFATVLFGAIISMLAQRRPRRAPTPTDAPGALPGEAAAPPSGLGAPAPLAGHYRDRATGAVVDYTPVNVRAGVGVGGLAGLLSGMLGIGGGLVQVPAMTALMRVPVKAAAGTSTFMVGFASVATATVYYASGEIDPQVVVFALLGVFAGSQLGPRLTRRMSTDRLIGAFVAIMLFLGVSMALQAAGVHVPWER
jgi:uncharacterized protein